MRRVGLSSALAGLVAGTVMLIGAGTPIVSQSLAAGGAVVPTISDWQFLSSGLTPPSEAACNAVGRRCFDPAAMAGSYNYAGLHGSGTDGTGTTIAIVDSFGSATIGGDLNNFDTQFSLTQMCGDNGITCSSGMPKFSILNVQGSPPPNPPPPNNGTGQEAHNLWALEVSLDVEWAHATAPGANILLVTTPTAETLGQQGFPQMMNAEQYVVDHGLADVITQSFGAGEATLSAAALQNLRHAFVSAAASDISVLASSGDGGTTNTYKEPVKNPAVIPYPSIIWPAADPLVTAVGGTYLCTNTTDGTTVDSTSPPSACQSNAGVREVGWIDGGGGYSIYFSRPTFQNTLPSGSTFVGSSVGAPGPNSNMRGIPDVAYQASSRTGVLVYMTEPDTGGVTCGGANPCSKGWYTVGGTSSGSPQWAGIVAMADQQRHVASMDDIGYLNPTLYAIANNPSMYSNDFYDVTVGNNQTTSIPGYSASTGWDAVTGLGTPNVANLIPDLVSTAP